MEKIIKIEKKNMLLQFCLSILFILNAFIYPFIVYADNWPVKNFKIVQLKPSIHQKPNFFNHLKSMEFSDLTDRLIDSIDKKTTRTLENYLAKVALEYEALGFKPPAIDDKRAVSGFYAIYVYDYPDKGNPTAKYSSRCEGLKSRRFIAIDSSRVLTKIGTITPKVYEDLAHELFHAVQGSYELFNRHCDLGDWITEGTAEAMGIEISEKIKKIKVQPLVRWGARHYQTALRVGDDIAKRRDEGYWTSSLWRYIGEDISTNGSAGVKQTKRPDYSYLVKLFDRKIEEKTNESKELKWLDDFLKSNESKVGKGLAYVYPNFITTFSHYLPTRGKGEAKNWQKCLFTNINCRYSKIEKAKPACEIIELSDTLIESKTSNIKFNKVSARCIKVSYKGVADNLDIIIKIESNDESTIKSLRTIGMRTNPLNKQRKIKVEVSSSGRLLNGKHFSEWTFQNVNFRKNKRYGEKSVIFVISNVAEKASKTHKNPEVSFTVRYPNIKTDVTTSDSQGG